MNLSAIPLDTTPEAYRVYIRGLRALTPDRRARMAAELSDNVRATALAGIRERHPEYGDRQVRLAFLRLVLGADAFRALFPGAEVRP